jgi:hypothetical protein
MIFEVGMLVLGMMVWLLGFAVVTAAVLLLAGIITGIYHGIKKGL